MPQRSLSRPSSRQELPPDDEELLADSSSPIATSSLSNTSGQDHNNAGLAEPLPPLNLTSAIAYSSARAKVIPQLTQSFSFQPPRPHKSSFSVPPSSRAPNTFSVVDSEDPDALHARAANYETLLRQFSLKRQSSRPSSYHLPAASASVPRPSRLQRGSSAEDLRHTLTRLGSSLSFERIRRRSNEGSSISMSTHLPAPVTEGEAPHDASKGRASLSRSVRRLRHRVESHVRALAEPLSPQSLFSHLRHTIVLLLLCTQLLYLPFAPTFLYDFSARLLIRINIAMELTWLLDLALQFNTAVVVDDPKATTTTRLLVTSRSQIAQSYLHGAFLLDALASLPVETVASLARSSSIPLLASYPAIYYAASTLRLLKYRLLPSRLDDIQRSPIGQWLSRTQYRHRYASAVAVAIQVLLLFTVAVHYLACGWYVVMAIDSRPPTSSIDSGEFWVADRYVHALVDVSLLISGDGVIAARMAEACATAGHSLLRMHLFVLLVLLLGVVLSAFAFARLATAVLLDTLVHQERSGAYHLERSLASLTARMDKLRLPEALQDRVKQYFTHLSHEYGVVDGRDSSLFHFSQAASSGHSRMLSAPLALEVALCRYTATLGRMGLWKSCSADFMSALIVRVEPRVYLKDDFVRRKGEISTELLIVQRGTCEYMTPQSQGLPDDHRSRGSPLRSSSSSSQQQRLLTVGASLGQLALIIDYKFPVYVRAVSHVEVGIVRREVFQELVNRFVDDRERLVRRIFRTGLEGAEHPALWQLVNRFHTPTTTATGATVSATTTTTTTGGVAVATRTIPPLVRQSTASTIATTSDRRITTREAAKTLVRVLEISTMPSHARLSLPLVLEPEALRGRRSHRTLSISTRSGAAPVQRTQTSDQPPLATTPAAAATAVAATETEGTTDKTPTMSARAESQVLEEVAQTQSALLHLVQTLTDAVTKLDEKVSRMEERVHRSEDTGRNTTHVHGLLRRRSSHMDSEEHVLLRRRSSYNGSEDSSDWRDGGHLQVPRMLPPDEMAVLRASAMASALGHKSDTTGESRPPSSAYTDRQTRFQSSRTSEVPQSTFDEEALTLRGVYMLSQLTSRSTPPTSSRDASSRNMKAMAMAPRTRARSLSTSTRQRLNAFQTSLHQAITTATLATEPSHQRRRASLSTMWTRAKPLSTTGTGLS